MDSRKASRRVQTNTIQVTPGGKKYKVRIYKRRLKKQHAGWYVVVEGIRYLSAEFNPVTAMEAAVRKHEKMLKSGWKTSK